MKSPCATPPTCILICIHLAFGMFFFFFASCSLCGEKMILSVRRCTTKLISQKHALKKVFSLHVIEYWCSTRIDHMIEVPLIANPREPGPIQFKSDHFISAAIHCWYASFRVEG